MTRVGESLKCLVGGISRANRSRPVTGWTTGKVPVVAVEEVLPCVLWSRGRRGTDPETGRPVGVSGTGRRIRLLCMSPKPLPFTGPPGDENISLVNDLMSLGNSPGIGSMFELEHHTTPAVALVAKDGIQGARDLTLVLGRPLCPTPVHRPPGRLTRGSRPVRRPCHPVASRPDPGL